MDNKTTVTQAEPITTEGVGLLPARNDVSNRPTVVARIGAKAGKRSRRGSALLLVILLLAIFSVTATMVMSLVTTTVRSAHMRTDQIEAFNMADAGLDLAEAWLVLQSSPPSDSVLRNMTTNFWGTNGTFTAPFGVAGSTLTVAIYSDSGNVGPTQKKYLIESKAQMPSGVTQVVRVYVRQISFGKYAFFTNNDGGGFWDYNNHFEGPFHSNDGDGSPSTFLWKQNPSGGPIFNYNGPDAFSCSGNPTWWLNTIGNTQSPSSTADFNSLALGGKSTMTYGYATDVSGNVILDSNGNKIPNSSVIALPNTDYAQEYVALGMIPPNPCTAPAPNLPTTNGAVVTSGGGIFIHGDSQMALSVDGNGNQVVTVTTTSTSGTTVQTITINSASGTSGATMVSIRTPLTGLPSTTTTTVTTPLNGMIFTDGNITSLSGTVANNRVSAAGAITSRNTMTIATDTGAGKNITLTGSVKYSTSRNLAVAQSSDTNYNTNAGILGIEAANVIVLNGAPAQLEFDASIFCTGTFQAANPGSPVGNAGTMTEIGGVIVNNAGIFAYGDQYGNVVSGYNEQYHYDQRLSDYPPPYFPTTGSHYDVISWQNVAATIQ